MSAAHKPASPTRKNGCADKTTSHLLQTPHMKTYQIKICAGQWDELKSTGRLWQQIRQTAVMIYRNFRERTR